MLCSVSFFRLSGLESLLSCAAVQYIAPYAGVWVHPDEDAKVSCAFDY
jgi:hypothetical protein